MIRRKKVSLKRFASILLISAVALAKLSHATEMEKRDLVELNDDIRGVICNTYKKFEIYDDYPLRLDTLRDQAVNFSNADKVRKLAEESMFELLKINHRKEILKIKHGIELDLLCIIKYKEIEGKWLNFYQEYKEQYLTDLHNRSVNTSLVSASGDHTADMAKLESAVGLEFFEKLTQKWEDVHVTKKIYQQVYGNRR